MGGRHGRNISPSEDVPHVGEYRPTNEELPWEENLRKFHVRGGYDMQVAGEFLTLSNKDYSTIVDLKMQASTLDARLPKSLKLLTGIVNDPKAPMEWRSKMLEVMILRGAVNEVTYKEMKERQRESGYDQVWKVFPPYQEAARDAIFANPEVFNQLTKSPDQLRTGRTAATEIMNTMLRNGGMYGSPDARQEFESRVLATPAETRGRMMYHMEDAGRKGDIHHTGEERSTGWSLGVSIPAGGAEFGKQWDRHPDEHWRNAGNDVTRAVNGDFLAKAENAKTERDVAKARAEREAFDKGYAAAKARDNL